MRIGKALAAIWAPFKKVPLAYYLWGVLFLLVAFGGFGFLYDRAMCADKVAQGQILQAAVAWAAGVIGLATFFLNRDQKQKHLDAQLQQAQAISDYEAIQKEFEALSDDFAQKEILPRVNAAIGLANLAKLPDPRLLKTEQNQKPTAQKHNQTPQTQKPTEQKQNQMP
jgi:hypothetical protein